MGPLKAQARSAPVVVTANIFVGFGGDNYIFVADRDYELVHVREAHRAAGAAAATIMLVKCAPGVVPPSGVPLLASNILVDSTVNTPVAPALTTTRLNRQIRAGEMIAYDATGNVAAYDGIIVCVLQPMHGGVPGY